MRAESSPAAHTGAFVAVSPAPSRARRDCFAPNPVPPAVAEDSGDTTPAAGPPLSACVLLGVGCRCVGCRFARRRPTPPDQARAPLPAVCSRVALGPGTR
jgi:hypothetical protein